MIAEAVCSQLDRFARERIDSRRIDAQGRIDAELLEDLGALGLFGLTLPESHGGLGLPLCDATEAVRTLAAHDRSVATTVGLHLGLGTRGIVAFGTPAQQEVLPALATGTLAAFAATEPGAGSDLSAIATRAVVDGDTARVDGTKVFVTNGGLMGVLTVLAATPGHGGRRGHGLVVLRRDDPGVTIGPEEHKLGLRGSSTTPIYLDAVQVPADRILGEPGAGMEQAEHVLSWGRTLMSAGCLGAADAALALAIRHVRGRRQFRRTLASLDVVRRQLADALAMRRAMEAVVQRAAEAADLPDGARQGRLSMVAKILCSDGNWAICDLAVQLHGGLGFIEESGLPLLLRDARVTRIFEGANDVLLVRLGALEATAPQAGTDALSQAVTAHRARLLARHGAGLLRRQDELHGLGRAVVARESALALAGSHDDLAAHWVDHATQQVARLDQEPPTARVARIADRHLDGSP